MTKWVLCSERLPKEHKNYLCSVEFKQEKFVTEREYNPYYKEWNDGDTFGYKVIAWMELPKPYGEAE